jgi:hypothetical protein
MISKQDLLHFSQCRAVLFNISTMPLHFDHNSHHPTYSFCPLTPQTHQFNAHQLHVRCLILQSNNR